MLVLPAVQPALALHMPASDLENRPGSSTTESDTSEDNGEYCMGCLNLVSKYDFKERQARYCKQCRNDVRLLRFAEMEKS